MDPISEAVAAGLANIEAAILLVLAAIIAVLVVGGSVTLPSLICKGLIAHYRKRARAQR